ncbi:MAG: N-6 DNA methylase, partial [Bacteroidetes bacterium]|nr:N-6 DNA methylase [Bacteroidota bacterium]
QFISYGELPENIRWIVDDIAEILNAADINQILDRYYDEGKGKDPIIHFYETFLAEYNPNLREQRGVYYTPEPVVKYIVRSVHNILKTDFGKPLGLADSSVTVLDPAAGTLTFIAEAFKVAVTEYAAKYGRGGVKELIKDHLLEHFYAFELMMAPYAIGHLKMGFILEEFGYTLSDEERFKLYLTNTLDMEDLEQTELPGMASLSDESKSAGKIKKDEPVLVILGNPPYSGNSFNTGEWIDDLLKKGYKTNGHVDDGYYSVDGKPLGERNPKMLQDDYVKFMRFAQWKIDQHGQGIVAMITNHGYLDNPTFRGMRQSLMKSFDEISVLDLHGNYRKKETAPDGSKDENVFDIQQGVAIHTMLKKDGLEKKVQRADVYGKRDFKYEWLDEFTKGRTTWEEINPKIPFYFFKKVDHDLNEIYTKYISIPDLFIQSGSGVKTHRDNFVMDFDQYKLKSRIKSFISTSKHPDEIELIYQLRQTKSWNIKDAKKHLSNEDIENQFTQILYRPFNFKEIFYHSAVIDRPREEIFKHFLEVENLAILARRQFPGKEGSYFLVSDKLVSDGCLGVDNKGRESIFPLYLYSELENDKQIKGGGTMMMLFEEGEEYTDRRPNINKEFYALLENVYREQEKNTLQTARSGQTGGPAEDVSQETRQPTQSGQVSGRIPSPEQILYLC